MRLAVPALALSSFMGFRTAADAEFLLNIWKVPAPPAVPEKMLITMQPPPLSLNEMVRAAALKHGVAPAFIKGVIAAESGFEPAAVSAKGAVGLMQLMPETAREMGASDPQDPAQNVEAGASYLKFLIRKYGQDGPGLQKAVAAYNAGPGNVDKYRGIPPFKETRSYVKRVLGFYRYFAVRRLF